MAAQTPLTTRTANGAAAVTAAGVMHRMQQNGDRGGALVAMNASLSGSRTKKMLGPGDRVDGSKLSANKLLPAGQKCLTTPFRE